MSPGDDAQVLEPRSHGGFVLKRHRLVDLGDVVQLVDDSGGQELADGDGPELGVHAVEREPVIRDSK